jgi:hypothetical protein
MPVELRFDTPEQAAETWRRVALELANVALWPNAKGYEARKAFPKDFCKLAAGAHRLWSVARSAEETARRAREAPTAAERELAAAQLCDWCGAPAWKMERSGPGGQCHLICGNADCCHEWDAVLG